MREKKLELDPKTGIQLDEQKFGTGNRLDKKSFGTGAGSGNRLDKKIGPGNQEPVGRKKVLEPEPETGWTAKNFGTGTGNREPVPETG